MLANVLEGWTSIYSNHAALRTCTEFLHVGGLLAGGGCAVAADRITLRASTSPDRTQTVQLDALQGTHRVVLAGLAAVIVSGVMMFAADVDAFLYSKMFWLKMALMVLLIVNGSVLLRAERRAHTGDAAGWRRLVFTARASVILWFVTTLVGAALPNL